MTRISLEQANALISAAFSKGRELGLKPLSAAVTDAGGHLLAFQRQNGAPTLGPQIAMGKAGGALGLGMPSRKVGDMAVDRPILVASLNSIAPHGLVPAAGGVIVVDHEGLPIGAIGVSGDTSDNDEACALAAIASAGLIAQGSSG